MNADAHLIKARRLERSANALDHERDTELAIEGIYGAAHHYIAYTLQKKHGEHTDKHSKNHQILKKYDYNDIRSKFETLDSLRAGDFYGGKTNGERVARAKEILKDIKSWGEIE